MAKRGLIIAIEDYTQIEDELARALPGTHAGALAFRRWLIDEQSVDAANILFCTEDAGAEGRTSAATRNDIVQALNELITAGQDETEQLYFYFSGHGFCFTDVDQIRLADVLVAADYSNRLSGSGTCISIDEVQRWLRVGLGPGDQYFFLDCCRNKIGAGEIKVSEIGPFSRASNGFPGVYTLYSATEGELAAVQSGFTDVLIDGLKGNGRAKVWYEDGMAVLFRSVKAYVHSTLAAQPVDAREEGSSEGVIRLLKPPPQQRCEVLVENAEASDAFHIAALDSRGRPVLDDDFVGPSYVMSEVPDDYGLTLTTPDCAVVPVDPLPADLYEDRRVRFRKAPTEPEPPSRRAVIASIGAPASGHVIVNDLQRGGAFDADEIDALAPGFYTLDVMDERAVRVNAHRVEVRSGEPVEIDLGRLERSPLRDALLERIPGAHDGGAVDFSSDIGLTPDQGLDLWLAIIGASRILAGPYDDLSKLDPLPLETWEHEPPGSGSLYVLAGFDSPSTRLAVGVNGEGDDLQPRMPHPEIPGLFEIPVRELEPGGHLLTLRVDDAIAQTLPVAALPNRATLVTVQRAPEGGVGIQQFVLPIPHLAAALPYGDRLAYEPALPIVRRLVELQRQFAKAGRLTDVIEPAELSMLLYGKWFEPIGAVLAAYEIARRGGSSAELTTAVRNLRNHFSELPDTEAIARRAGQDWSFPATPPLVLDGLMELDRMSGRLPLPPEDLDYRGPWTLWRRPDV